MGSQSFPEEGQSACIYILYMHAHREPKRSLLLGLAFISQRLFPVEVGSQKAQDKSLPLGACLHQSEAMSCVNGLTESPHACLYQSDTMSCLSGLTESLGESPSLWGLSTSIRGLCHESGLKKSPRGSPAYLHQRLGPPPVP